MQFKWYEVQTFGPAAKVWQLNLVKPDAHGRLRSHAVMGTLARLGDENRWRVLERKLTVKPEVYILDGDLTLDEAQRAAKLFLCVGRT